MFSKINKRGSAVDIFILIIIAFITVLFFAGWMFAHQTLTDEFASITTPIGNTNVSAVSGDTLGQVNTGIQFLRVISFIIIFGLALSILISNFLIRANPVFFVVYFFVGIIAVVFSAFVSNAYEALLTGNVLSSTLAGFTGTNFFMLNLPIIAGVIALFGAIFLFINVPKDSALGGGVF